MSGRIYLVSGEPSGDALGADFSLALLRKEPDLVLRATGGYLLGKRAERSSIDVSPLSVLGLWEGLRVYPAVRRLVKETCADILAFGPDSVVLIDSWGFTLRVARAVRAAAPHIKLIKLIGPQVWATRAGRARTLAATVDHLLCIHDFEVPYYTPFGLDATVIGHPALSPERVKTGDAEDFRSRYGVSPGERVLAVFPGSRRSEFKRMSGELIAAAERLQDAFPGLKTGFAPAGVAFHSLAFVAEKTECRLMPVRFEDRFDLMAAADLALASSGTVTTEIAANGTPVITGYKTGTITWLLARHILFKADHISLVNMAAGARIMPELLQSDFTADNLVAAAEPLLADEAVRQDQIAAQNDALLKMGLGEHSAAEKAAETVLALLDENKSG